MGNLRRITAIKKTEVKIKYLLVANKVYRVINTDFSNLIIEASETDLVAADVPADELFSVTDFKEFRVRLRNWKGNIVKFPDLRDSKWQ